MRKLLLVGILVSLVACHGEHVTGVYTLFWHSEKCHPEIWYKGQPPNASPACNWQPVNPPPSGVEIN